MRNKTINFPMVVFAVIFIIVVGSPCQADSLSLGEAAEKAGHLEKALIHYVDALKAKKGNPQQLREKIIRLVRRLGAPSEVPENYHRHMARGEVFVETAQDKIGFAKAAEEFTKASNEAPWRSEVYYNLGIVQDKAGQYDKAIQSLKLYLLAAPNASDTREVRTLIYKIEARREAQATTLVKKKLEPAGLERIAGIWRQPTGNKYNEVSYFRGEIVGKELLLITVFDNPHSNMGKRRGDENPAYRIRKQGNGFSGSTATYDSSLATQEIKVDVNSTNNVLKITSWHKLINPPKMTLIYHRCRNERIGSCGS